MPPLPTPIALVFAALFAGAAQAGPAYLPESAPEPIPAPTMEWPATNPTLGERDWRDANATVGHFERGHIDLLRWEAEHLPRQSDEADSRPLLNPGEAVKAAFSLRPALFATTDMSPRERATTNIEAVELARTVQQAWVRAATANAALKQAETAFEAASIADELAARMTAAGNWGRNRFAAKRLELADAAVGLAQARHAAFAAREALIRASGLSGESLRFSLPTELPPLPDSPLTASDVETEALTNHPEIATKAAEAQRADRALPTRAETLWNQTIEPALSGRAADPLGLLPANAPLLDLRRTPIGHETLNPVRTRAEANELAIQRRSQAREAWHAYATAHEIATLLQRQTVPLTAELEEDAMLRYNGMLKSTWDLIDAVRERIAAESTALDAQQDFWLAHINLQAVLAGAEHVGNGGGIARVTRATDGGH